MKKYLCSVLGIMILFSSCNDGIMYKDTQKIEGETWDYGENLRFDIEVKDTSQVYNILLDVDHDRSFSFQNLYLNIKTHFPNGSETEQVVSLEMQDGYGQWVSICKGNDCAYESVINEGVRFSEKGKYTLELSQHSREKELNGIKSCGIIIEKA